MSIFVFGSNLAGRHGKGAALYALKNHGAIYGQGWGIQGNSFGIPTKGFHLEVLSLEVIESYIRQFLYFAEGNQQLQFDVTPIGCGLAGYKQQQIKPLFLEAGISSNVHFTKEWTI